jgi:Do/DeqQ family serine protease
MKTASYIIIALLSSIFTLVGYNLIMPKSESKTTKNTKEKLENQNTLPIGNEKSVFTGIDFNNAAKKSIAQVVHIKSSLKISGMNSRGIPDIFKEFFGDGFFDEQQEQIQQGSGSGVIIGSDGYIVTNNHVIAEADEIEVVLNDRRSFRATLVGTDPSTDLALLKIDDTDLPTMEFGNSNDVNIGDWVLAVGNPFNLSTTVTAGIVSAKARNINILKDKSAIESFIQTDAAVNPGNSGGALVNLKGELIGINTAIASPTGTYAGYSFAIPVDIVKKVVEDLKNFGIVQRAYLGVLIREMNADLAKELDVNVTEGVLVDGVVEKSAAELAGIKKNDIIQKINDIDVKTVPQLLEIIGSQKPGDKVTVEILRDGKQKEITVTLKNIDGSVDVVKKGNKEIIDLLGAELEEITDKKILKKLKIDGGVQITGLKAGKLRSQTNVKEGFIITKINKQTIVTVEDVSKALEGVQGGVMLEGVYPDSPGVYYFAFGM